MMKTTAEFFGGKTGVEVLLDTMKHQPLDLELVSLALQYFLHIAADHSTHLSDMMKESFQHDIVPQLLKDELTKELLVETIHRCACLIWLLLPTSPYALLCHAQSNGRAPVRISRRSPRLGAAAYLPYCGRNICLPSPLAGQCVNALIVVYL